MHELSIAHSLVELAAEEAERLGLRRVRALYLKLGVLSGVVKEALQFSFDIVTEGTSLEGADLVIEDVPVVVYCPRCQEARTLPEPMPMRCPVCGTRTADVRQGREMELYALEGDEGDGKDAPDRRDQTERSQKERLFG
ncbi:MAG: hydrogenase maturation nickel metallochaperone HypA [Alicyclobacillaceae bacterium]|nr:hydrogenase maturation nickel metallochaperone HypA [Alicyclobacillaceae bacterium]